jgi:hypothetical protein
MADRGDDPELGEDLDEFRCAWSFGGEGHMPDRTLGAGVCGHCGQ